MMEMKDLNSVETFALQVLLAQKIEATSENASIFNGYKEREIYVRILEKLCPLDIVSEVGGVN